MDEAIVYTVAISAPDDVSGIAALFDRGVPSTEITKTIPIMVTGGTESVTQVISGRS
mgnify:CR=1 FL=1